MITITTQLFDKAGDIIQLQPEVLDPTNYYHMADDGGVETEVGEFLYSLVRVLQPEAILETGTYTGISAMYMGAALQDNNHGLIWSVEWEKVHVDRAKELWNRVGLSDKIISVHQSSLQFQPDREYELIFLDSEPELRFKELVLFYKFLKPGGYFFIHDLHRHLSQQPHEKFFGWPFGELPREIKKMLEDDELRVFSFPTPRGLTGFYKPRSDDYKHGRVV